MFNHFYTKIIKIYKKSEFVKITCVDVCMCIYVVFSKLIQLRENKINIINLLNV